MAAKTNQKRTNTLRKETKSKGRAKKKQGPGIWNKLSSDRSRRILGLFLVLFSIYLLIVLISYLFNWKLDDSLRYGFGDLFSSEPLETRNLGGRLGHLLSYMLIKQGFGIASLLFPPLFFIIGVKLSTGIRLLPLGKTSRHLLTALIWLSVVLAFILQGSGYELLGGTTGNQVNLWLERLVGEPGTGILLFFILAVYFITSWNLPWGKWFGKKQKDQVDSLDTSQEDTNQFNPVQTEENNVPDPQDDIPDKVGMKDDTEQVSQEVDLGDVEEKKAADKNNQEDVEMTVEETQQETLSSDKELKDHYGLDEPFDPTLDLPSYQPPGLDLLKDYPTRESGVNEEELKANKERIVRTLQSYGIKIEKIKATIGPTITLYEIVPAPGIRISKIKNLSDDIALSLSAIGIRIIAPLPGKGTIGIEVPNQNPEIVSIKSVLGSERFKQGRMELPIGLGKTISNESFIADLTKMPHLLIAGATGQGKSVGLNAIITSLLYRKHPAELKFIMVDPKKVELTLFNKIERHFLAKLPDTDDAIITDTRSVVRTLNSLGIEMDKRYDLLNHAQVRNIKEYNKKFLARKLNPNDGHRFLPYLVLVIDEFADLIMTAGKEVEIPLTRLAQLARAIGIHLVIATQRPSTNIITGTIKANFPARIAFRVISQVDSRTILDSTGANHLVGRGDMLLSTGSDLIRLQCAFVDTPEVDNVTEFIGSQRAYPEAHQLPEYLDEQDEANKDLDPSERDDMFEDAAKVIVQHQHGSTSLLQRKLKLGYNRAGRIIDQLEAAGIVGPFEGSKAREVKIKDEASLEQFLKDLNESTQL